MTELSEPGNKVVFFHVLKTGGMTFRRILSSIYGKSFHVCDDPSISAIRSSLARFDCLEFHTLPHGGDFVHMHCELARQRRWELIEGHKVFIMFREPVDQVVSQYFYLLKQRAFIEPAYNKNGVRFPQNIAEYLSTPAHFNNQLAFVAGKYSLRAEGVPIRDDLTEAKDWLRSLRVHVGLTERFADSLHTFEVVTGRRVPNRQIQNQNENPHRLPIEEIPDTVKDRIRENSLLDLELYEFAKQLFIQDRVDRGPAPRYDFISVSQPAEASIGRTPAIAAPSQMSSALSNLPKILGRLFHK